MSDLPKLSEQEVKRGLRYLLFDGGFFSTMTSLCGGLFVTAFALMLGASSLQIGLLVGLPNLANASQPLGAYLVERFRDRRRFSVRVFAFGRSLWLLVLLLPYFGYTHGHSQPALYLLLLVTTVSAVATSVGMVSETSLMADIVPVGRRGRYFGSRNMVATAAAAFFALIGGQFLDHWQKGFGADSPTGFMVVYGFGLIAGLLSVLMVNSLPEPRELTARGLPYLKSMYQLVRHVNFRRLVVYRAWLSFATAFVSPFFTVYMLENLHLSYSLIAVFGVVNSLCSIMALRPWGRLSDHFGHRPIVVATIFGAGALPLIWLATAGGHLWVIFLAYVVGGTSWAGVMLGTFNLLLKITPDEDKSVYIGTFNAVVGIAFVIGSVAGGVVAQALANFHLVIGHSVFINFHLLMLLSGIMRLSSVALIRRVREPDSAQVRRMVQVLWHTRALNPWRALHYYWYLLHVSRGDRGV